jgi:hypothetical protein
MAVGLLETNTCSAVGLLKGKCNVVTCINLIRAIGHDEPEARKHVLDLASRLLTQGGHLLQIDKTNTDDTAWGKYGNVRAMKEYASSNSLNLRLYSQSIDSQMMSLVWRK